MMRPEEFEKISDLEYVGNCIISRSKKIIMVRLPFSEVYKFFDLTKSKYSMVQVSNESDDEIENEKGLVFVVVKYKKDEDFSNDVNEICTK